MGYTRANFAYGSTPLSSWLRVFEKVEAALKEAALDETSRCPAASKMAADGVAAGDAAAGGAALTSDRRPVRYTVVGSSLGALALYGACVYGWRTRGLELLDCLVVGARAISNAAHVTCLTYERTDGLCADYTAEDVVMLASQCWDAHLVAALGTKLLAELHDGAIVVDYTDALFSSTSAAAIATPADAKSADASPANANSADAMPADDTPTVATPTGGTSGGHDIGWFECCATVRAPVSWNGAQQFFVWRVRRTSRLSDDGV